MLHAYVERFDVMGRRGNILGWDGEVNKAIRAYSVLPSSFWKRTESSTLKFSVLVTESDPRQSLPPFQHLLPSATEILNSFGH
jgi:hypothetical protein